MADEPLRRRRGPLPVACGLLFLLVLTGCARSAGAFHDRGAAACSGCHVMHESQDGQLVVSEGQLLGAGSPTEVCLGCHASGPLGVASPDPLGPGPEYGAGDFAFLLEDNIADGPDGALQPIGGHASGHNVVAPGAGLVADPRWPTAPGGSFPSSQLGCTSCHDPHGNANYRMLHGPGEVQAGLTYFSAPAPQAEGVALGGAPESASNHTAYQDGWSRWCGNCHDPRYHWTGQSAFQHPVDRGLGTAVSTRYGEYLGDANPTGGSSSTAYLPEVPFEDPAQTPSSTNGPFAGSRISCMSCHRAHATSAPEAGRWDFAVATLGEDGAISGSLPIPNPWPDPGQRSLCVKCHAVDHDGGAACLDCHLQTNTVEPPDPPSPVDY